MTGKRFTTVELPKPNRWGIWYDGACLSTYQVCILLNEYVDVKKENEQLKKILGFLRNDNANDILNVLNSQENQKWELKKENDHLKEEIKDLNDVLARYEEKELKE